MLFIEILSKKSLSCVAILIMLLIVTTPFSFCMKGAYPELNGMIAFTSRIPDNGEELFVMNGARAR